MASDDRPTPAREAASPAKAGTPADAVQSTTFRHAPVTTLAELDALDSADVVEGYSSAERGDPEPGANHSRAYHHGWRTRMMDLGEIPIPPEHRQLVREWLAAGRNRRQA